MFGFVSVFEGCVVEFVWCLCVVCSCGYCGCV